MKKICLSVVLFCFGLALSCSSKPEIKAGEADGGAAPQVEDPRTEEQEEVFDPGSISQDIFQNTKLDVQRFISNLNTTIREKNYAGWKAVLSEEYFDKIASPEFLKAVSERPMMQSQKLVLKTPQEYFLNVVVPSRANARVDDIQFITRNRVKAFTIKANGQRERIYDLENTENSWMIIN